MVTGAVPRSRRSPTSRGQEVRREHRPAHGPLPQGQARRLRAPAAWPSALERVAARSRARCSSRTCGTARPCRSTRTSSIAERAAGRVPRPPTGRASRSRSAWSAARRTASSATINDAKLYTTPERRPGRRRGKLGLGEHGRYLAADDVRQRARRLQAGQRQAADPVDPQGDPGRRRRQAHGKDKPFDLVFHGGSGSLESRRSAAAVDYGVVKMNVDTDTQYAYTRPVADHMLKNYDGVLKIDGEVGNKKTYDPRTWGKLGRGGPDGPCRAGLPGPALRRHPDRLAASARSSRSRTEGLLGSRRVRRRSRACGTTATRTCRAGAGRVREDRGVTTPMDQNLRRRTRRPPTCPRSPAAPLLDAVSRCP